MTKSAASSKQNGESAAKLNDRLGSLKLKDKPSKKSIYWWGEQPNIAFTA